MGFQAGAHLARPGGLLELFQGALEHRLVVLGQLRVGILQRPLEILDGEFQKILLGGKAERCAEHLVPGLRVRRLRAAQVHGERRIVTAEAVTAGAHIDRGEGIQGLGRGLRAVAGHAQAELVTVAPAAQFQLQRIADHLVVAHDALEDFPQAGAGHQCIAEGMEGGGADVGGDLQAQGRVAAGFHRQLPEAGGGGQRVTCVGVVHQRRVQLGLAAQLGAVEAERIQLLAQGAGPAGEGSGFAHAGWRIRSTGWRARSGAATARGGTVGPSSTRGWKHVPYARKSPEPE
ncbi:hypothetical protein D9M71_351090 [compost metagenome]